MVVTNVNIPTDTWRASWFVRVRFHLGGGQIKLHELSVRSVKKAPTPVIHEEEQEIPDDVPIDGWLQVDTISVKSDKDEIEATKNGGEAPTHVVPNTYQIIQPPVPPNNEQVVETQPVLPEEN